MPEKIEFEYGSVVSIWKAADEDGWYVAPCKEIIYVYPTLRSALRKAEFLLKSYYCPGDDNAGPADRGEQSTEKIEQSATVTPEEKDHGRRISEV